MGGKARVKEPLSEELAQGIRESIGPRPDIVEKRMFGGIAFLLDGKMCCGVNGRDLMVRVAEADYASSLEEPHTRAMDFTGRPLRGFLYVAEAGWQNPKIRKRWIDGGIAYAAALPAKKPNVKRLPKTAASR